MSGSHAGLTRPSLHLVPHEADQVVRLAEFRAAHPHVIIGDGGSGPGRPVSPQDGETVTTRYTLRELLDRLDEITGDHRGHRSADRP